MAELVLPLVTVEAVESTKRNTGGGHTLMTMSFSYLLSGVTVPAQSLSG